MDLDLDTVDRLLTTTRAVRKRLDLTRPVPPEVITDCIRLAIQAPTAGDSQGWRWVAIADDQQRAAIGQVYRAANEGYVRGQLATAGEAARRRLGSVLHLIEHLHEAPVLMLAYVLDDGALPPPVLYGSIYPAVWNFQLALRSRGLATTPLYLEESSIADIVGAPPNARLAALMPVAYFTGETFQPAKRLPVDQVLSWDRWG